MDPAKQALLAAVLAAGLLTFLVVSLWLDLPVWVTLVVAAIGVVVLRVWRYQRSN
jgi:Flp pilus assembly protein TadB